MSHRPHNFNAGPAVLPLPVLEAARNALVDTAGTGMSVLEWSHRAKPYEDVHRATAARVRRLLGLPDAGWHVLFLQGGASLQFAQVPMNLAAEGKGGDYVVTGHWAEKAYEEAARVGHAHRIWDGRAEGYARIPRPDEIRPCADAAYLHLTSNNTIFGTQWPELPETGAIPLVADMSSDILSRTVDGRRFGLIYAGAQKNLGPAGVTLVVVREDLVGRAPGLPRILDYRTHVEAKGLYNTPPTFAVWLMGLVLAWIEDEGGLGVIARRNEEKAARLYAEIDRGGFYRGTAERGSRSRMNVTFRLKTPALEARFLEAAEAAGLVGLAGHRAVGGIRASLYNALPMASVEALCEHMREFERRHG